LACSVRTARGVGAAASSARQSAQALAVSLPGWGMFLLLARQPSEGCRCLARERGIVRFGGQSVCLPPWLNGIGALGGGIRTLLNTCRPLRNCGGVVRNHGSAQGVRLRSRLHHRDPLRDEALRSGRSSTHLRIGWANLPAISLQLLLGYIQENAIPILAYDQRERNVKVVGNKPAFWTTR
jgi:hypothetical protein